MNATRDDVLGIALPNGTRITHGQGGNIRRPMPYAPVVMNELYLGATPEADLAFRGQLGFIEFDTDCRLPRHVHIGGGENGRLLPERILVLNGVGVAELGGEIFVVAPGSLVDIPPGLPHTWNACPPGVVLPDGRVSDGHFTMVYNYSETTKFFPTAQTRTLRDVADYDAFTGDVEDIRFPNLTASEVVASASCVWDREIRNDLRLADPRD